MVLHLRLPGAGDEIQTHALKQRVLILADDKYQPIIKARTNIRMPFDSTVIITPNTIEISRAIPNVFCFVLFFTFEASI